MLPPMPPQAGNPAMQGQPQPQGGNIEAELLKVLTQMAQVAEQNGIDFLSLVEQAMGGGGAGQPAPTSLPMPPGGMPPMA